MGDSRPDVAPIPSFGLVATAYSQNGNSDAVLTEPL
jgi:hypothetical protein